MIKMTIEFESSDFKKEFAKQKEEEDKKKKLTKNAIKEKIQIKIENTNSDSSFEEFWPIT